MKFSTIERDPQAEMWGDPAFVDAYLDALGDSMGWDGGGDPMERDSGGDPTGPGDLAQDDVSPASDPLDDLVQTVRRGRALSAEQDRRFREVLAGAAIDPEPWVGPDPTRDPAWEDPRGRSAATVRAHRRDFAVRAAAADLAVRVHLSDHQVRARAHRADVLITRCPKTWAAYRAGEVSEQNAAIVSHLADSLPARATVAWAAFDDAISGPATRTAPGRFRTRANAIRERVHPESIDDRHARAAQDRSVHLTPEFDGMARIEAFVPAAFAYAIDRRLEEDARHLRVGAGETRTLAQLRADIFCDLLTAAAAAAAAASAGDAGTPEARHVKATGWIVATVNLTIPVMTLLGASHEPATLAGYGPIDLETARRLAGGARHWIRVLTHPVTGTILDVDRRTYRVPKALRRWLGVHHPTCPFPGCTRPAYLCDIDHRTRWADGGTTAADNLGPLCRSHHPLKDETSWSL